MKQDIKLTVSIDDVNPLPGWRILGDPAEKWLRTLHEQFGLKFTLFIPSHYHNLPNTQLRDNKEWIQELNSIEWIELAAHGHFHETSDRSRYGECEFLELDYDQASYNLSKSWEQWDDVDVDVPRGFRPPGWLVNHQSNKAIKEFMVRRSDSMWEYPMFKYVAIHNQHNNGLEWACKEFFGHDDIQGDTLSIHNGDMIMFQSHICGDWNKNVWNQQNFEQFQHTLEYLYGEWQSVCNLKPKTLIECL